MGYVFHSGGASSDYELEEYEEFKKQITARGNTVVHNKAREACWQKVADSVNA